ncbi:MAG: hypothetical protein HYX96_07365 [Chloroflexi bacterium]|nr:hypothetical protein [Chloroflexota bacterium]
MKLRFSKTTWTLVALVFFIIPLVVMGLVYRAQAQEQAVLKKQISLVQTSLAKIKLEEAVARVAELTGQQERNAEAIEAARADLEPPFDSMDITERLFAIAGETNVKLSQVTSPGPTAQTMGKVSYNVLPLTLRVEGRLFDLIAFIRATGENYATSIIKSVEINTATGPDAPSGDWISARVALGVYSYEGK